MPPPLTQSRRALHRLCCALFVFTSLYGVMDQAGMTLPYRNQVMALMASPSPSVFYRPEMSAAFHIEVAFTDGTHFQGRLTPRLIARLPGPLAARQPYFLPIFVNRPRPFVEKIHAYGVCQGERPFLAHFPDTDKPVKTYTLSVRYDDVAPKKDGIYRVQCK